VSSGGTFAGAEEPREARLVIADLACASVRIGSETPVPAGQNQGILDLPPYSN
jgi:hypothetical protein